MSVAGFGAATIDGTTNVPLQWVFGCLSGVLVAGMWVSRKVTKFETLCDQFSIQQAANIARLDRIDERLLAMDERLWVIERKKG